MGYPRWRAAALHYTVSRRRGIPTLADFSGIPAPGASIDAWRVVRELGRGGMACVLEVEHAERGERRALKLLLPSGHGEEELRRFRREFRALQALDHPNVIRVFDAGVWSGRPWFVMELLEGRDLRDEVDAWRSLSSAERLRRADAIVVQLARALDHIHRRGLVHRDVTPTNVIVTPEGRAVLMDFGVVKEPGADLTSTGSMIGTVAYIAPEQILGDPVDARADLYALGAVYYLMLTGRRPFNASTVAGFIDKHLHRPPRPPRELVPTLPDRANEACLRLLAKKPEDRFASARHLLLALDDGTGLDQPGATLEETLRHPPLVGRTATVTRLRELLARLGGGAEGAGEGRPGGLLEITGEPGMGRSRVAGELVRLARELGIGVSLSRNRSPDQPAFMGLRPLYEDLLAEGFEPSPVLEAVFHPERGGTEAPERWAVLRALGEFVRPAGPRLLLMADPQRADRGTLEMVEYLVRNLVGGLRRPLLVALTRARPEPGADAGTLLGDILAGRTTSVPAARLDLGPISAAAVEELLLGVVTYGPGVRTLAERIHQASEGNPYVVCDTLRTLLGQGVIRAGAPGRRGTLVLDRREAAHLPLPVPRPVREIIRGWLAPLPPEARAVLEVLAVARHEVGAACIAEVGGLDREGVAAILDDLVAAGLARRRDGAGGARHELPRNRLRDVILGEMAEERRQAIERAMGGRLEAARRYATGTVAEHLAHHFERGGVPAKAMAYFVEAAERKLDGSFIDDALDDLAHAAALEDRVRAIVPLRDVDLLLARLHLVRARALFHLGRSGESAAAAREADRLAELLDARRIRAEAATLLAQHARRELRLDEAERLLRHALKLADALGDAALRIEPLYELGALQWSRGDLDGARDAFIQALATAESCGAERMLALGANGLGLVALCRGQSAEARRHFEQAVAVSEKYGLMDRLAVARTNLVEVYHLSGNFRKGLELADRALAHAREVNHRFGIALALRYRCLVLTDVGRFAEAVEHGEESLAMQRELANAEDVLATLVLLARAHIAAGRWEAVPPLIDEAEALIAASDTEGFGPVIHAWQARRRLREGDRAAARACLARAREPGPRRWPFQKVRTFLNIARAHEEMGELPQAAAAAEEALAIADASGFRYYALRAREVAARTVADEVAAARHRRVVRALARSLAANLAREDAERFLAMQGLEPRRTGAVS